jgi:hypothetical protein
MSYTKSESKFLSIGQSCSRKFLVAADFCFANIFMTKKCLCWMMNFTFSHSILTGMNGFWIDHVENTSDTVRYKADGKFEPKILVWYAISESGVSTPFIGAVKLSMLTFISPNVYPKWSNSSRITTKMTKQSFGPIW